MSHFTVYRHNEEIAFHYNSDLSGEVTIVNKMRYNQFEIVVPGNALLSFVANWVRDQKIAALEKQSTNEVLGLGSRKA